MPLYLINRNKSYTPHEQRLTEGKQIYLPSHILRQHRSGFQRSGGSATMAFN